MLIPNSVLADLLQMLPQLRPQIYFKSSLTALSHAMEDQVLASGDQPLIIASFQRERFYRQEAHRYRRIAQHTSQVYVLAAPETEFKNSSEYYETVAFEPQDGLSQEWHLVVLGEQYATCLICHEREATVQEAEASNLQAMDQARRFEGIWTVDRQVSCYVANLLLNRILQYRPELAAKIKQARKIYGIPSKIKTADLQSSDPFSQRLVTYLQAGQHKLLKAYRSIAAQERKERLVNLITAAIRQSLNPQEIIKVAVQELGEALSACRCLIYRCKVTDTTATICHEFLRPSVRSLMGQTWPLKNNALFQEVITKRERVYLENTQNSNFSPSLQTLIQEWKIAAWLMVPVLYQGRLLGMVELHQCGTALHQWQNDELGLADAIATQLGAALIQAETYANLEELNQQLEALDRTRSNLIAIIGHELRTPLSTIQVCLESLNQDPEMLPELRQVMLETALLDADRLRKLVQDFLTLSHLESGRVQWHLEALPLQECIDLALSSIRTRNRGNELPQITVDVPPDLPLVQADGEWLVELLSKLLDNACKFTPTQGQVTLHAQPNRDQQLEVTIMDTGRGIEPNRLEAIFERFHQEEGALRRTAGGTGLGLAICRQIVAGWGGSIWADSAGKDRGSKFYFTIPFMENTPVIENTPPVKAKGQKVKSQKSKTKLG